MTAPAIQSHSMSGVTVSRTVALDASAETADTVRYASPPIPERTAGRPMASLIVG